MSIFRNLAFVACLIGVTSIAEAQQSRFGNRGPMAGPNGFGTGSMGMSPGIQSRNVGSGLRYQPSNTMAPTGMFDRRSSSTFGPGGLSGTFSRSLVGSQEAGPSFNRGLAQDDGAPRGVDGLPVENFEAGANLIPIYFPAPPVSVEQTFSLPVVESFPAEVPLQEGEIGPPPPPTPPAAQPWSRNAGTNAPPRRATQQGAIRQARKLSKLARFQDVSIGLEGGIWTLRGEVDSFETRDLAETFATLEPGVEQVRNEIVVRGRE